MGSLGAGRIWSAAAEAQAVPGAGCWGRAALLCGHQAFGGGWGLLQRGRPPQRLGDDGVLCSELEQFKTGIV